MYGLPEGQAKAPWREEFERVKHEENMRKQAEELRPNEGKQVSPTTATIKSRSSSGRARIYGLLDHFTTVYG